jgi:serine kinase of HPr protein (carbohydrate metabolism regulator)
VSNGPEEVIHATCIALDGIGVLLLGPPGSGKSDLALRLIDTPGVGTSKEMLTAQLVADDQVKLSLADNHLIAEAPPVLAGFLEIRGLGIMRVPYLPSVRIGLAVQLRKQNAIERLPDLAAQHYRALGIAIPLIEIDAAAASAPARVRAAVLHLATP